uniref:BBS2_C domain-containing protein n=1 Tax=Steinernema glaseri TaxID=37863 RepID=A0A1I7Z9A0_9BILA
MSLNQGMDSFDLDLGLTFEDSQFMDSQVFENEANEITEEPGTSCEDMEVECEGKTDKVHYELEQSVQKLASVNKDYDAAMKYRRQLDDMAVQVKQAVLLREAMEKCASDRKESLPLDAKLKVYPTSDGPIVIFCEIRNYTQYNLDEWGFTFTFQSCDKSTENEVKRKSTYSVNQKLISAGKTSKSKLYIADYHQFPAMVHVCAVKTFNFLNDDLHVVRIQLDPIILTRWDLFTLDNPLIDVSEGKISRTVLYDEKLEVLALRLHDKAVYLLCQKETTPEALLRFIFDANPVVLSTHDGSNSISGFVQIDRHGGTSSVTLTIQRRMKDLTVLLQGRNIQELKDFRADLQLKILLAFSRIRRRPIDGIENPINTENLDTMFATTMSNFV